MITLIMVVCLSGATACIEQPQPIPDGMSCLVDGQQIAADWLSDHPKWELKGWRCRYGEREHKA